MTAADSSVTVAEYNQVRADQMTEKQLQNVITAAATRRGYLAYHTHDSRRSQPGFPDLVLVHPQRGVVIVRELKTTKGRVSTAQQKWLDAMTHAGLDAGVWRPIAWFDGTIDAALDGAIADA